MHNATMDNFGTERHMAVVIFMVIRMTLRGICDRRRTYNRQITNNERNWKDNVTTNKKDREKNIPNKSHHVINNPMMRFTARSR